MTIAYNNEAERKKQEQEPRYNQQIIQACVTPNASPMSQGLLLLGEQLFVKVSCFWQEARYILRAEGVDFLTGKSKSTGGHPAYAFFLTVDCMESSATKVGTSVYKRVSSRSVVR